MDDTMTLAQICDKLFDEYTTLSVILEIANALERKATNPSRVPNVTFKGSRAAAELAIAKRITASGKLLHNSF